MRILFALLVFVPSVALAGQGKELDAASTEALDKTKKLLADPKEREKAVAADARATDADQNARQAAGGSEANTQKLYELSAEVMDTITRESGGDPEKMQSLIADALKNPEAFAAKFTPDQKARLKAIAEKAAPPPGAKP
ncbi:MAG: hypothetical protein HY075_00165 [Deltaproteobacteria bacterium]|nr:hypothetical protein [Deltaproteobacteria bacterium]